MREIEQILDNAEKSLGDSVLIYEIVYAFTREYPGMSVNDILKTNRIMFDVLNINIAGTTLSRAERRDLEQRLKKTPPKTKQHKKKKHK